MEIKGVGGHFRTPSGFTKLSQRTFSTFIMSTSPVPGRGNPEADSQVLVIKFNHLIVMLIYNIFLQTALGSAGHRAWVSD